MAATFIALVAVSAFVLPTIDNADLSVDMDVDYGGDTLTYMVSLMNASANAKYYVVVMEGSTVVYEKEITGGYQTGIVEGLDGTKDHRVEIRTGLIPLKVVDSATIPGQDTPYIPVDINNLTAVENTIVFDMTVKEGSDPVTLGVYAAEGEEAVFTQVLNPGANTGTATNLMFNHEYIVKLFGDEKTYIIKAVTTDRDTQTPSASAIDFTYGETKSVVVTGLEETPMMSYAVQSGSSVTVNESTGALTWVSAGEAVIRASFAETEHYKAGYIDVTVTTAKGTQTATDSTFTYTYSGANQLSVDALDGAEVIYTAATDTVITVTSAGVLTWVSAGDADVVATIAETDHYAEKEVIITVTTQKATPEVSVVSAGNTYNGSVQDLVSGSTTGGTLQYKLDNGEYGVDIPQAETVDNHTVYYKVIGDDNYNDVAEASIVVSLLKATYDMTDAGWNYVSPFTYDGGEKTVSVTGLPAGVTVNEYSNNSKTDAGDYTASVTLDYDSTNYNEPDAIADCPWTIDKADAVITLLPAAIGGLEFTDGSQALITGGTATGGQMQYSLTSGSGYSETIPTGINATTYTVYYKVIGYSNYNDVAEAGPIEVTIAKAQASVTGLEGKRAIYSGSAEDLVQYTSVNGGTLYYYVSTSQVASLEGVVWSASAQATDKNTYYVYYKIDASNSNYNSLDPSLDNRVTAEIVDAITYSIGGGGGGGNIYPDVYINQDYGSATIQCRITVYDTVESYYVLNNELLDNDPSNPTHYNYDNGEGIPEGSPPYNWQCTITVYIDGTPQTPYEQTIRYDG